MAMSNERQHLSQGVRPGGSDTGRALWLATLAVLAWLAAFGIAAAAPKFPELTGRIVDSANLITPADRTAIEQELAALEAKSTDQIAVVTVPSLDGYTIEDYGYQLGRHWGIGQEGKDNGALLVVAPNERKVRIEVGRRLEPLLTDTMSRLIIENSILPRFRRGDFSGGIRAGVRDMQDVLLGDAEAVKDRAKGGRPEGGEIDWVSLIIIAFWIGIFIYVIYAQARHARQYPGSVGRRGSRDGGTIIVIPGGSSDWGGSGGGWDSGGGGGWSGGGGDFGGGGASGSW
jgi:uncharacterized protein